MIVQSEATFSRHSPLTLSQTTQSQGAETLEKDQSENMEAEIKAEFSRSGFDLEEEEEVLKKCLTFCIIYKLNPSELVSSWELYYLNRQLDGQTVSNAEMDGFLLHLQNEQKEAFLKEESDLHVYSSKDVDMILNGENEDIKEEIVGTPTEKSQRLHSDPFDSKHKTNGYGQYGYSSGKSVKHVTPFGGRTEKFVTKFSIDNPSRIENRNNEHDQEDHEDDIIKRIQPRHKCSLKTYGSGLPEPGCRFMHERIEDKFNALESRIRKHADALVSSGMCEELVDPSVASQRSLFAVGMISCDGEGHLNDKSILLQSSAEHASGLRVRVDMSKVNQFSIFPGQVVGIEGHNPSGHCLIASKLIDSIPVTVTADMDLPPAKKQVVDQEALTESSSRQSEISLIIASGPFTTTDNLHFEPLKELLAYARRKSPQLLLLLGPFIDSDHPEIGKGATNVTFNDIFQTEVLGKLQDYVEYMGSEARVILLPSVRDAHHDFVFPQPAFDIHSYNLGDQIASLSNPAIFEANQVKVGCCTADILKQLSGEELSRTPSGVPVDRMARLASHVLRQRSFYPLYPQAETIPLDFSLAPEALQFSSLPDILILPSDMKYFVKVLSVGGTGREGGDVETKCVCVNPGRLAKGEGGGSFVELHYNGSPDKMVASIIAI